MPKKWSVKPEGREGLYLVDPDVAMDLIRDIEGDEVHNLVYDGSSGILVGMAVPKDEALEFLAKSPKSIAILVPAARAMGHQLVALTGDGRCAFDVGEITVDDLAIA